MKKNSFITLSIFFIGLCQLFAQKTDTIFYDRNWDECTKKQAGYYRIETEIKTQDTTYWAFKDHYIDNNQVQNEGFLAKKDPEVRQGKWVWYYANGKKEMEGDYVKNNRVGTWNFYHNDGGLKKTGNYSIIF